LRKPEKLSNLIERLKLESELKFTMSGGNVFHRFTMRSVKNRSRINATVSFTQLVHEWRIRSETQNNHHNVHQHIRCRLAIESYETTF